MKSVKALFKVSKVINIIAMVHAFLLFLCNLLGSWVGYHLMGFGWLFWQVNATAITVLSFLHSIFAKADDYGRGDRSGFVLESLGWLALSVPFIVVSVGASAEWGFFYNLLQQLLNK